MIQNKKLVLSFLMAVLACGSVSVEAQSTYSNPSNLTSSPYTRYGFGKLGNVGNASTRGMGDAGIATRTNLYTNLFNPASLTAIDTLTMLFDVAFDGEWLSLSEEGKSDTRWDAGISYLSFHFPLWNRFAGSFSYMPYSMVGYEYGSTGKEPFESGLTINDTIPYANVQTGNGGLQHFQLSMGWNPLKTKTSRLDVGATVGYICGYVAHTGSMSQSHSGVNGTTSSKDFSCIGWDLNLGAQYTQQIQAGKHIVVGATYSPKTHIGCDVSVTSGSGTDDNAPRTDRLSLSAPQKFGAGLSYQEDRKLTVTVDYAYEGWADLKGLANNMNVSSDVYQNVNRLAAGVEYRPKLYSQNYFQTCIYRAGFSMNNSYIKEFSHQKEYSATCGMSFPITGRRSLINFSASYHHLQPDNSSLLKENSLRLTLGITFNETMFYRSKLR